MAFHCPECQEARVEYIGLTDDARSHLRCQLCGHEWFHGAQPVRPGRRKTMSYTEARAAFPGPEDVPPAARARANQLKAAFLDARPMPDPEVASFWSRYQRAFSADGLPEADPATLKFFANTDVGAHPGNMSVFNRGGTSSVTRRPPSTSVRSSTTCSEDRQTYPSRTVSTN